MIWFVVLVTLLVLVIVHEFGHWVVAYFFQVGVSEFSIGFGRPLWTHLCRGRGMLIKVCPILLGGYIKFSDDKPLRPGLVLFKDLSVWKKILVLLAGPAANLLLAFCCLMMAFKLSTYTIIPYVGTIQSAGVAQRYGFVSGQRIVKFNHIPVNTWEQVFAATQTLSSVWRFELKNFQHASQEIVVPVTEVKPPKNLQDFFQVLGLQPQLPQLPAVIGRVQKKSVASLAGLQRGDRIVRMNTDVIDSFLDVSRFVQQHPASRYRIEYLRGHRLLHMQLYLKPKQKLGIYAENLSHYPQWFYLRSHSWGEAVQQAYVNFLLFCRIQLWGWWNLSRELHHLSGPVGIAKAADQAWFLGLKPYLLFVVWLNIGLAIVNLLPIPILDGGQCIFVILERCFPGFVTQTGQKFLMFWSIMFLLVLFVVGLANDWPI